MQHLYNEDYIFEITINIIKVSYLFSPERHHIMILPVSYTKPLTSFCLIHFRLYGWAQYMWTNHYHLRQHHQPGSPLPNIHPQSAADLHHDAPLGLHRLLLLHQDRVDGHHQGLRLCSEHLRRKLPFRGPYCRFT